MTFSYITKIDQSTSSPPLCGTFCLTYLHDAIIAMVEHHFCAHPLIPGYSAPTELGIQYWAVKQIYTFCVDNGIPECWAYLWENWYCPDRWKLWARAGCDEIPILKTTMICESQ